MSQDQGLIELQFVTGIHELFDILFAPHVAIIQELEIQCSLGWKLVSC